jgi:uncharacterized membrane protein (DUF106 family)
MDFLVHLIAWINTPVNIISNYLLAPVGMMPGWLSNSMISALTGVFLLVIFKYTSNQKAIGNVRDGIKADMLAIKLFKDSTAVIISSQVGILSGAVRLFFYAIKPMMVMIIPVLLLLSQMGVWYQARPLLPGEDTNVTLKFNAENVESLPDVSLMELSGVEVITGPVRIFSKHEVVWKIRAADKGTHLIKFLIDHKLVTKRLTIGDSFMRISSMRPGWRFSDILMHPIEKPFDQTSKLLYISVDYPDRDSMFSGTDWWIIYFFICSMVFALLFKPVFKVRI